jgi:thiol-disulfide isomerase/thioredoxin
MKLRRIAPIAALLLALSATSAVAEPAALDLARFRGKVVLVDFWASWCGPCKQAFPFMVKLLRQYPPGDLVVITINEERQRAAGEVFLHQVGSTLPVVWDSDGAIGKTWAVNEMPTTLLFDRKGKMRFRHQGFVAGSAAEYQHQVDGLVRER